MDADNIAKHMFDCGFATINVMGIVTALDESGEDTITIDVHAFTPATLEQMGRALIAAANDEASPDAP